MLTFHRNVEDDDEDFDVIINNKGFIDPVLTFEVRKFYGETFSSYIYNL